MAHRLKPQQVIEEWIRQLPPGAARGGCPAKGTLAIGLIVLERLRTDRWSLDLNDHLAAGKAQVQGASGVAVAKILARHGEHRRLVSEGGRTNRGTPAIAELLLTVIKSSALVKMDIETRVEALNEMQSILVEMVRDFHNRARLAPHYDPSQTTREFVRRVLVLAAETGKCGPVAQYLVGAKLQLRFPEIVIRNENSAAADAPSGQPGDFVVGDMTFHVTIAPNQGHFDKCRGNLEDGRRVVLLVPESSVVGVRQLIDLQLPTKVAVESIESFVAQNVEELSQFDGRRVRSELRSLIELYNVRVDAVETDKSLLIEIPHRLQ
ncbi:MAG: DUF4928 family protein [Planctomycetota bacterium]|nr:DUF4928 family protein [Planctomycetota bacterium]